MDKLAKEAKLAWDARLSYGKWKAMQPKVEIKPKEEPDSYKCTSALKCQYCGKEFYKRAGTKYCSSRCNTNDWRYRKSEQEAKNGK